ncbi:Arc family DNA-binding protein [Alishewanella sp. HL-SH06]|uniref:Arc family DNA-binding protein n=1 Tax=Alishewanella sp. HL-SH06 TaxID=3461144 RepID=UPI004041970C
MSINIWNLFMTIRDPQINIRLPAELKDKIHRLASENKRSVNAEVVAAIEHAVELHSRSEHVKPIKLKNATGQLTHEELINKIVELLNANGI